MGHFLQHFFEWYCGITFLAFLFLFLGAHVGGTSAFFKSLLWPVVACEYVEICNQKILGNNVNIGDLK